jgi:hypothetical protein
MVEYQFLIKKRKEEVKKTSSSSKTLLSLMLLRRWELNLYLRLLDPQSRGSHLVF